MQKRYSDTLNVMVKKTFGLSGKPVIRTYHLKLRKTSSKQKTQNYSWRLLMSGVFVAGAITGITVMVSNDYIEAEQAVAERQESIAGATTTEAWTMPLDFSTEDLNVVTDMLPILIQEARHEPTKEELANQKRKDDLLAYFKSRNSPFADQQTVDAFLSSNNMKLMIAISFVESTMGKKCYYHNCSGIGGYPPDLRKYDSYADWVKDFDALLERRYKGMDPEDLMGVYVQPGSPNWINGVKQILTELNQKGIE